MKQEDIDKLKEICEKEGLYFDFDQVDGSTLIVREKKIEPIKYDGWDHSDMPYQILYYFTFDKRVFNSMSFKTIGEKLADHINLIISSK